MSKPKSVYVCRNCGADSPKWIGRCNSCGEWNTYTEEIISRPSRQSPGDQTGRVTPTPQLLEAIDGNTGTRIPSGLAELDRILGNGMMPGSLILLGGEPGVGKSTLALQLALSFEKGKVMYVSGEESEQQIKQRAGRISKGNPGCYILCETDLENIILQADRLSPEVMIIDSIQTMSTGMLESSAGSVSQVRECAAMLLRYCKNKNITAFLIGHITKDGTLAGPKVLEHIVDVVLQFEGERNFVYRILRSAKNRFGSTAEIGIFEMVDSGLREVPNPSELFINHSDESLSGVAIAATMDGIRPFLIETQSLVSSAVYGTPQRSATGFDTRRLNMLLAVLEKRAGFRLGQKDVFLNIAGGIKVTDPAIDLAVVSAVLSSSLDIAIGKEACFAGEVGLTGEIRAVPRIEQRINEAARMGFAKIYISKGYKNLSIKKPGLEVIKTGRVEEVVRHLFG